VKQKRKSKERIKKGYISNRRGRADTGRTREQTGERKGRQRSMKKPEGTKAGVDKRKGNK